MSVSPDHKDLALAELSQIVGVDHCLTAAGLKSSYERDKSNLVSGGSLAVVFPSTAQEVSEIVRWCRKNDVSLIARGGGTGVTGGAVSDKDSLVISLSRMDKVIEVNATDRTAWVEAGVISADLAKAAEEKGLYYPPLTGSFQSSLIGGNIATCSGSPDSAKYGTIRPYILNLEVVLADGSIIRTGADVNKSSSGLHLTSLFIGSEGTLGIITKALVKLLPRPAFRYMYLAGFKTQNEALLTVELIAQSKLNPVTVEFLGNRAIDLGSKYLNGRFLLSHSEAQAHLIVELDGFTEDEMHHQAEWLKSILSQYASTDILTGQSEEERRKMWMLRGCLHDAMTQNGTAYRDLDVAVPLSNLALYLKGLDQVMSDYELDYVTFGHALDGNLHTMILSNQHTAPHKQDSVMSSLTEIYKLATQLKGCISGEHGIGLLQKEFLPIVTPSVNLELMRSLKQAFDPDNLLNPGKIF